MSVLWLKVNSGHRVFELKENESERMYFWIGGDEMREAWEG